LLRPGKLFVVIDYAETRRDAVIALLRMFSTTTPERIRVVLLARAVGDWWDDLRAEGDGVGDLLMGPTTHWSSLAPLALSTEDRLASYRLATERFSDVLRKRASSEPAEDLAAPHFERILLVHMMALAGVEGIAVKGENGILDWMLARERRFLRTRAAIRGLSGPLADKLGEAIALFTLIGGAATRQGALAYLAGLSSFKDQTQANRDATVQLLHECYPGTRWIDPVQPDLLGEELIAAEASDEILALAFDRDVKEGNALGTDG
jgi:hypothetical protein